MNAGPTARLEAIDRYGVLERAPSRDLQALAELAAQVMDVDGAAINIVTDRHQHQVATVGVEPSVCTHDASMCAAVLDEPGPVVVPDAPAHERLRHSPFVTGELASVRFYASAALTTPAGVVIGRLCTFDPRSRQASTEQVDALCALAERVMDVLELRLRTDELESTVAELTHARNELARSNDQLGMFAAQVSHDLTNPLTAMLANLEVLASEPAIADDEHATRFADAALRAGGRMARMMSRLLAYARVGGALAVEDVDLAGLVRSCLEDAAPLIRSTRAQVDVGTLPTVRGDGQQLYAVLLNLLTNALKYATPGDPPRVTITSDRTGDGWTVRVDDHGAGVDPGRREEIFAMYNRGDHSGVAPGSGIGLAVARRVIEAHGGRIGVTDGPDGTTRFWFELPDELPCGMS
ncbi:sensor histidine kinase [Cellulomonas bogoriensis]|uniref:Sensor-like histidine kinase SenX3 n=1 Tax=Cellulomonas bogoriensis 69B4 = DSM 16987 TaxID=1386082 RepID=A0A0A0C2L9_9CELL|nr:GAF domain-containing sensor histidine kinase [Cellulomonas bogoriensis]KGM14217.1 histidine kinase [Cellulomonas bogoriensis 69B4 = DSM 16987]